MIARLASGECLKPWQQIAIDTHLMLDAIHESVKMGGGRVPVLRRTGM